MSTKTSQIGRAESPAFPFATASGLLKMFPGLSRSRLRSWRERGYLHSVGQLRGDQPDGGCLLYSRDEVERLIVAPPKRGRRPNGASAAWQG